MPLCAITGFCTASVPSPIIYIQHNNIFIKILQCEGKISEKKVPLQKKKPHAVTECHSTRLLVLLCYCMRSGFSDCVIFRLIVNVTEQAFSYSYSTVAGVISVKSDMFFGIKQPEGKFTALPSDCPYNSSTDIMLNVFIS